MKKKTAAARKQAAPSRPSRPAQETRSEARDVATRPGSQVSLDFEREMRADAGAGVSTKAQDNLVPLIYVLQPLSPQVLEGPENIEGAEAGDIWLKNAEDPVIDGQDGVYYQPCHMYQKWTRWTPRKKGGGFQGAFDYDDGTPPAGVDRRLGDDGKIRLLFDNGDECVDTRYEAGIAWRNGQSMPYVIPFKSTGHTVSKGWMTKRQNLRFDDGTIKPAFSHLYRLTTKKRSNSQGTWYILEIGEPIYLDSEEGRELVGGDPAKAYQMGKALMQAFSRGEKRAAEEAAGDEPGTGDDAGI